MSVKLEDIQKALDMYLENKRQIFPRFYFLSNDDVLEILGQSQNPEAMQPHLKKCFDNIKSLRMDKAENFCYICCPVSKLCFIIKIMCLGRVCLKTSLKQPDNPILRLYRIFWDKPIHTGSCNCVCVCVCMSSIGGQQTRGCWDVLC